MAYDIFISYRRIGGEHTAKILRDHLQEAGYNVFFDLESLRSGEFNIKLYSVIDECTDFLLILSPGALDRCDSEDDWVRREVEYALEKGKNVVPVMLRGFTFPDVLPATMEPLRYRNGLEANAQFFDAFMQQLKEKFLLTKPGILRRVSQNTLFTRTLPVFLALVLLVATGFGARAWVNSRNSVYPYTNAEKNLTNEVVYYAATNLTNLDLAGGAMGDAIQACRRYLSAGDGSLSALQDRLAVCRKTLEDLDPERGAPQKGMLERLVDSPYPLHDVEAMYDAVKSFLGECIGNLDHIGWMMGPDCHMSTEDKLEALDCYQTIADATLQAHAYSCNQMFLPVTSETALEEFWHRYLPELTVVPLQAAGWETDAAVLESEFNQSWKRAENALLALTAMVGNTNMENSELADENAKLKETIIKNYMDQGLSREQAEDLVESLMELRELCLPQPGDDVNLLWEKMSTLLAYSFYEDARACVDAYWALAKDQPDAQKYLPAARAFIDFCEANGLYYGVMVMAYDETAGINEVLEIGDVIVAFNDEPCVSYEAYVEKKAQCTEDVFTLLLLRMDETGKMAPVQVELTRDMPAVYLNTVVAQVQ